MKNSPTHVFDKNNNGITFSHGVIDEGVKLTRSSKFETERLRTANDKEYSLIRGVLYLLVPAIVCLVVAGIFSHVEFIMWAFITLATGFVGVWGIIYAVPVLWKNIIKPFVVWLYNVVTYPVKLILLLIIFASCSKEGELQGKSMKTIEINGKKYDWIKVVPADGEKGVWLLIPEDSNVELPKVTSYTYSKSCGKNCTRYETETAIWIL